MANSKPFLEDLDSWELHVQRRQDSRSETLSQNGNSFHRYLKHHKTDEDDDGASVFALSKDPVELEKQREKDFWSDFKKHEDKASKKQKHKASKRKERLQALFRNPGIAPQTTHGLMIDAGSTGSRLHVYEWEPRILSTSAEIQAAVTGDKLSFPGTESRWTERLRPGLDEFASMDANDTDALDQALQNYLQPLLDFAESVLHSKSADFGTFPIYLRATAGMRILDYDSRARVMASVRRVLANSTFNKFRFQHMEQARVLSGEEEAIYDWTGVNFLLGDLLQQSQGAGTVVNPKNTHGALDLGGGSTQISFFDPNEDVMSNLFKLQIGQAKHWNLYAHSFLYYGMNEAIGRHGARLAAGRSSKERIVDGLYDPCLPSGSRVDIRTNIHLMADNRTESWDYSNETFPSGNGYYQATLFNDGRQGSDNDVDSCLVLAMDLLHLEKNAWCDFDHKGDCSFAGVYQPRLPKPNDDNSTAEGSVGDFIAFSGYYHVWKFLDLAERSTIEQLYNATRQACALDLEGLAAFVDDRDVDLTPEELPSYCFRSAYVFNLLHHGYGFEMNDSIRVVKVIDGHQVGWALGAMLYEINTLPWTYKQQQPLLPTDVVVGWHMSSVSWAMTIMVAALTFALMYVIRCHRHVLYRHQYDRVQDEKSHHKNSKNDGELQLLVA